MSASPERNLPALVPFSIDRTTYYQERAFAVGSAAVESSDTGWGRDPSTFSPEEYGNYAATSDLVYAAGRIRASNIGKLQVKLWKEKSNGELQEVTKGRPGSLYELTRRVNPFWTMRRMLRMIEWSRVLWGQGYVVLNRGTSGKMTPSEMWWVRPDKMRVQPHPTDYISGYLYEAQGTRLPFSPGEVLWFPSDNPIDEFAGLAPLAPARLSVDTSHAATQANRKIFTQGMMAAGMVTPDKPESSWTNAQMEQIKNTITDLGKGVSNAHSVMVLSQLARMTRFAMTPAEMQYLDQLKWSVAVVARVFGVPASMLQENEHATYNNRKSDEKALWTDTLIPEAEDIGDVLTEFLVPMFPGECDQITLDYSGVAAMQEDRTEITDQAHKWWTMGVPLNRLLEELQPNLLPVAGGGYPWGDLGYQNYTLMPPGTPTILLPTTKEPADEAAQAEQDGKGDNDGDPIRAALSLVRQLREEQDEWGYGGTRHTLAMRRFTRAADRNERTLAAAMRDLFGRQEESVLARLRKRSIDGVLTRDDDDSVSAPFDTEQWEEKFREVIQPLLSDIFADGAAETLDGLSVGVDLDINNPEVRKWLDARARRFAVQVNETTWAALKDALGEGMDAGESIDQLSERVKGIFTDATQRRAEVIARTEVVSAFNSGGLAAAKASGVVTGKTWLSALDTRVRDSHAEAHGQTVGIDEDFTVGSGSGPAPGDLGVAEEDIQCRCTMTWVMD